MKNSVQNVFLNPMINSKGNLKNGVGSFMVMSDREDKIAEIVLIVMRINAAINSE